MAQLLECDRCGERTAGHIKARGYGYSNTLSDPGGPSVPGWKEHRGKLLCPQCDKNLDSTITEFLKRLPEKAP